MALAQKVADALWPDGTYGRMVDSMIGGKDGLADMFLDMKPAEIMASVMQGMAGAEGIPKAAEGPPPGSPPARTLREELVAEDPHFEERMRITMKVIGEEVTRISKPIEPKFRAGLAKSIARRFSSDQLGPIATFFGTDAGKAYAAQSMTLFIDKDVMLAMIQSIPAVMKEMPAAMERVKKATAHLPPPPKPKAVEMPPDENVGDSGDNGEAMPEDEVMEEELPST